MSPPSQDSGRSSAPPELDRLTLERCKRGDAGAFREFVLRYQRPVLAVLSRILGTGPQVEDCAQEVFIKAHAAFSRFDPDAVAKPSTWLLTIATRVALDALKAKRPEAEPLDSAREVASEDSPEQDSARRRLGLAIASAAERLSPEQRAAFVLFQYHEFTLDEIATALSCPRETV